MACWLKDGELHIRMIEAFIRVIYWHCMEKLKQGLGSCCVLDFISNFLASQFSHPRGSIRTSERVCLKMLVLNFDDGFVLWLNSCQNSNKTSFSQ